MKKSVTVNGFDSAYWGSLFSSISQRCLYIDKIIPTISKFYSSLFLHSRPGGTGLCDDISCIKTNCTSRCIDSFPYAFQKLLYTKKYKQSCLAFMHGLSAPFSKPHLTLWDRLHASLCFAAHGIGLQLRTRMAHSLNRNEVCDILTESVKIKKCK